MKTVTDAIQIPERESMVSTLFLTVGKWPDF